MGSIGDRAASLMIGGRKGRSWGRAASSASRVLPPPSNPDIHEISHGTAVNAGAQPPLVLTVALIYVLTGIKQANAGPPATPVFFGQPGQQRTQQTF